MPKHTEPGFESGPAGPDTDRSPRYAEYDYFPPRLPEFASVKLAIDIEIPLRTDGWILTRSEE